MSILAMKINLRQTVANEHGKTFTGDDGNHSPLRELLYTALDDTPAGENPDGQQKYKIAELIFRIFSARDTIELSAEEVTLFKDRVGKVFEKPVVVLRLWDLLRAPAFSRFVPLVQKPHKTQDREATLVGQVKEPERRVNRTGHLVHFERTPGPCLHATAV
jgi:hypothetical protein